MKPQGRTRKSCPHCGRAQFTFAAHHSHPGCCGTSDPGCWPRSNVGWVWCVTLQPLGPGCPFSIPLPFCGAGDSDRLLPPQTQCSLTTQPAGSGRQEEKRGHDCYCNCACVTTCLDRQSAHLTYGWTNICADPGSQTTHFPLCPAEDSGQEPLQSHQGRTL
jgi:hypothetical protein